ncbi:hypothetical protein GCM10010215_68850 [Streptomyces virginiae]|uniref:Secreted protein n=1 Tax=Streptomyces virginiae TaxID=1961 RepID=A0ABQ3NNT8_STRVG|nr:MULTISPECIES: hypothetical protein [Streptomyces]KOU14444.1 hypothetical protein ADK49_23350 [Streptomyces sp. WM6349]KOV40248.1 hypothetical protein ADK98_30660 [Streptomyces sp. H036]MBP2341704.1 hypothetical protein [Streptomyces virginiae]MCI4079399.1 hypothetical protein [Streptomyces sp. MMS21 TC-5]GGQ35075.1 hypothetical protein GCM10010215_68850 [Streptomyces virginiae]
MTNSGLWVGALTALTALGASWNTARATSRAALAQARTTALAQALREQRDRRRSTYREMMACAHSFNEVAWHIDDADAAPDRDTRDAALTQMYERIGPTIGNLNRGTHEVRLDSPVEVSDAAERVRQTARRVQPRLNALIGAVGPEPRRAYDAAYVDFRDAYLAFTGLAREALNVPDTEA